MNKWFLLALVAGLCVTTHTPAQTGERTHPRDSAFAVTGARITFAEGRKGAAVFLLQRSVQLGAPGTRRRSLDQWALAWYGDLEQEPHTFRIPLMAALTGAAFDLNHHTVSLDRSSCLEMLRQHLDAAGRSGALSGEQVAKFSDGRKVSDPEITKFLPAYFLPAVTEDGWSHFLLANSSLARGFLPRSDADFQSDTEGLAKEDPDSAYAECYRQVFITRSHFDANSHKQNQVAASLLGNLGTLGFGQIPAYVRVTDYMEPRRPGLKWVVAAADQEFGPGRHADLEVLKFKIYGSDTLKASAQLATAGERARRPGGRLLVLTGQTGFNHSMLDAIGGGYVGDESVTVELSPDRKLVSVAISHRPTALARRPLEKGEVRRLAVTASGLVEARLEGEAQPLRFDLKVTFPKQVTRDGQEIESKRSFYRCAFDTLRYAFLTRTSLRVKAADGAPKEILLGKDVPAK